MNVKRNPKLTPYAKQLRKKMTREERHLWYDFLRDYPVRFMRQKVIEHYIVDFYCAQAHLVIEVDGWQHYETDGLEKDAARTACLERHGLRVLRFLNYEINNNFHHVCETIDAAVKRSPEGGG